jgi:hypothetical protein
MSGFSIQNTLSLIATAAVIGLLMVWTFYAPPDNQTVTMMAGLLAGYVAAVYQYHFGSSSGSKLKDVAITEMAVKATNPPARAAGPGVEGLNEEVGDPH